MEITRMSQLVQNSELYQNWTGKRGNLIWLGKQVHEQSTQLMNFKFESKDSRLSIKDISRLGKYEYENLINLLSNNGITIRYQKHDISIAVVGKSIHMSFTQFNTHQVTTLKVNHTDTLKQLKNDNANNDHLDTIQRIYQIIKDSPHQ